MSIRVLEGDARDVLNTLPPESVHCVVTSPPYYGLRDYGTPGQLGLEATPAEYIASMVAVFREVRRVLRKDGTLWLNIGDSYVGGGGFSPGSPSNLAGAKQTTSAGSIKGTIRPQNGLKPKDLIGIPWDLAKALRDPYYAGRIKAERDRAWLAAIIDGEGCISGYHHTRRDDGTQRTGLNITITNSSTRLLDEADRIWPGARIMHNHHGAGHLGLRDTYRWLVHGVENEMLLMRELYPYLIAKKAQAMVAYNLLVLMADAKRLGHSPQRDEVRDKRSRLIHVLSALNQDKPTEIPTWCVVPPSVLEDGWYLRSDIIWSKPNPMPESVTDRPTKAHEYLFLLTKSARYYYDADAIREPAQLRPQPEPEDKTVWTYRGPHINNAYAPGPSGYGHDPAGRNKRSVWEIATEPFPEAHFATYPTALVEPCIKAGTSEKGCCPQCRSPWVRVTEKTPMVVNHSKRVALLAQDGLRTQTSGTMVQAPSSVTTGWRASCAHADLTPVPCTVLDPFCGAGTTLLVADRLERNGIGIELNPTYAAMARRRVIGDAPMFAEVI